ncbi:ester cyclase [Actinomycetospora sp. TBRC 11914]|uniref:ester cyclase n=1 Tax=Actinomycetospora sp. TBRC 11914 TaxID=2729387 RepID=UPI00145D1FF3|nr:ester cyclase [Actinomycetospora sp. TBRC 11914]NMO93237.1 ester cyclase [Actinomycetospora sp. TBRC 11914]
MPDQAKVIRQLVEPWATGRVEDVDEILPADVVYHLAGFPDLDRDGLKQFMAGFHQSFPDFSVTVEEDLVDGDSSAHRWSCTGTFSGGGGAIPGEPTNRQTRATGTHVVHWRDGHPVEVWHFGDWLGWLQGAGVLPALG